MTAVISLDVKRGERDLWRLRSDLNDMRGMGWTIREVASFANLSESAVRRHLAAYRRPKP